MNNYLISIVVAIYEWNKEDILRLIHSISTLSLANKIQVVLVYSKESPKSEIQNIIQNIGEIKYIFDSPKGVYAAYEAGVDASSGQYVLFSGSDDFFMPGLTKVMNEMLEVNTLPDVIVSPVCFGDERILTPAKSKIGIVLKNWCQQGVLYRNDIFSKFTFDSNYPIQADHKFNIQILGSSQLNIKYTNYIISYFSCGGISQRKPDLNFWIDMPKIVSKNFGWAYFFVCLARKSIGYVLYGPPHLRYKSGE